MIQLDILMMATYFTHFAEDACIWLSAYPCFALHELSCQGQPAMRGCPCSPHTRSFRRRSTACLRRLFQLPGRDSEQPAGCCRKGPECRRQPSLQTSPSTGRTQARLTQNILRGFSTPRLSNADQSASSSCFCDVMLTEKIQGKRGNGTKLTVQDLKCKDCTTSDKIWWGWFLLLGYTIFVTTVIIAVGIHHCHTKSKNKLRNTDSRATMRSEWIYDQPSRPVNNEFSQEYEDMSVIRTLCDTGREMI